MKWIRSLALGLALVGALALAEEGKDAKDLLRPEVGKPLQAAQELMKQKQYPEALKKIDEAAGVAERTPYENFIIERMRGAASAGAGDNVQAAKSFEIVVDSKRLSAAEQLPIIQSLAGLFYRNKDYLKAARWGKRYQTEGGNDRNVNTLVAQAYYLGGDYTAAAREIDASVQADEAAGKPPSEETLSLLANCYLKQNDEAGYALVLERMVKYHPKQEYWGDLLARVPQRPGFAERLALDLFRLRLATGNVKSAAAFVEMTQLALQAGFPAEAKRVVEQGYKDAVLGNGADADRHKRVRDNVLKTAAQDLKQLAADEKSVGKAKDGNVIVNIGYNLVVNEQADKGIAIIEQGIARGGLKYPEDAKLHLGLAYLQAGDRAKAVAALKSVQGQDGAADLARLWLLQLAKAGE